MSAEWMSLGNKQMVQQVKMKPAPTFSYLSISTADVIFITSLI